MPAALPYSDMGYYELFGFDDFGAQMLDHDDFRRIFESWVDIGRDLLDYEDGEQVISVSLVLENASASILSPS